MQVVPILRTIDRIEHVGPRTLLPWQLATLVEPTVGTIAESPLRIGRWRIEMFDALNDVAVVMANDDAPTAFGRDLGADALAYDALVPQIVRLTVGPDAVGDHVSVEVVGIFVRREYVLAFLHADGLEQALRVVNDLIARRPFVFGIGNDQVIDGIAAAP